MEKLHISENVNNQRKNIFDKLRVYELYYLFYIIMLFINNYAFYYIPIFWGNFPIDFLMQWGNFPKNLHKILF